MPRPMNRRNFLEFLGKGSLGLALMPPFSANSFQAQENFTLKGIQPCAEDDLILSPGLQYEVLVRWGDSISAKDRFGFNNDFTAFIPDNPEHPNSGILWVNHEYVDPRFASRHTGQGPKTILQVRKEMYQVGGSIMRIYRDQQGQWQIDTEAPENRRLHAMTRIPFDWHKPIAGSEAAVGTLANCSGGVTPWGSILTCEENYDNFWGERDLKTGKIKYKKKNLQWHRFFDRPPEHYGWVVEVEPQTGRARKLVALGRCAHECATVKELDDGRVVVYTGDDANDECLYKFIGSKPGSLSEGTLYVADLAQGKWVPLDFAGSPALQKAF